MIFTKAWVSPIQGRTNNTSSIRCSVLTFQTVSHAVILKRKFYFSFIWLPFALDVFILFTVSTWTDRIVVKASSISIPPLNVLWCLGHLMNLIHELCGLAHKKLLAWGYLFWCHQIWNPCQNCWISRLPRTLTLTNKIKLTYLCYKNILLYSLLYYLHVNTNSVFTWNTTSEQYLWCF